MVVTPLLNVKLDRLLMPVAGDVATVAPVIVQVRVTMLLFGSETVAARPLVIRISQVVVLVLVVIGIGQIMEGPILFSDTVTALLDALTLFPPGSRPETVATFLTEPAVTSAPVTVWVAVQVVI